MKGEWNTKEDAAVQLSEYARYLTHLGWNVRGGTDTYTDDFDVGITSCKPTRNGDTPKQQFIRAYHVKDDPARAGVVNITRDKNRAKPCPGGTVETSSRLSGGPGVIEADDVSPLSDAGVERHPV